MALPGRIGGKIGRLVGAPEGTMMVADSTSVNLFKVLGAALAARPERRVILSERGNFPTDLYIAEGLAALLGRGHTLRLVEGDEIAGAVDEDTAVVMLTHVNYHTGAMFDMAAVTAAVQAKGALMLWDLAHSAGAVPVDLVGAGADLAVGCGYKFLNGGPGAPAFLYVAEHLLASVRFPLTGWLGHAAPFAFETSYRAAGGIQAAFVGTPPLLSLAALEVGVDIALAAPMADVRAKSVRQGTIFADLVAQQCGGHGLVEASPQEAARRGSQVCFAHPDAYPVMQALIARGVIGDFRAPDILRFGITPLYLRYVDLWDAVAVLRAVLDSGEWEQERFRVRHAVT
jgi:kynureninase